MNPLIPAITLCSICIVLSACRPQCDVVQVPIGQRDTLLYFAGDEHEVLTVIMPKVAMGWVDPLAPGSIRAQRARRGVNDIDFSIYCRGDPRVGSYANNMHDYRGEKLTRMLDDGTPYTWRFVKHICSPLGGWLGVFEYDAIVQGDSIYRQDYFARQEVANREMFLTIYGRFGNKAEQEQLRQEAFEIIASLEWLTASKPMGCD